MQLLLGFRSESPRGPAPCIPIEAALFLPSCLPPRCRSGGWEHGGTAAAGPHLRSARPHTPGSGASRLQSSTCSANTRERDILPHGSHISTDGRFGDTFHSRCLERWALNDLSMGFYGTSRGRTPAAPQDPLTFSALAAVGVGAIHALGTVLAGRAGTLVDVKLAQVPVEAWNRGKSRP